MTKIFDAMFDSHEGFVRIHNRRSFVDYMILNSDKNFFYVFGNESIINEVYVENRFKVIDNLSSKQREIFRDILFKLGSLGIRINGRIHEYAIILPDDFPKLES